MKHLLKRQKRQKPKQKHSPTYNEESSQAIYCPERCVICGASLGDAELGTMICYACQNEDPMFFVPFAYKHKKI